MHPNSYNQRGFSLIELLVVLIALCVALAFIPPTLDRFRDRTHTQLCLNQVKQIIRGLDLYEQDNQTFPYAFADDELFLKMAPPGRFLGDATYDRVGWWWQQFLYPYCKVDTFSQPNIFNCPARQAGGELTDNFLWGNYGINQSICRTFQEHPSRHHLSGRPLGLAQLKQPSQTLLVSDSGYNMLNWSHVTLHPAYEPGDRLEDTAYLPGLSVNTLKPIHEQLTQDALQGRHKNASVNTGYGDGSAKTVTAESLKVEFKDGRYDNLEVWNGGVSEQQAASDSLIPDLVINRPTC